MIMGVDFKDIKSGDKVMIVDQWRESVDGRSRWNHEGMMDHHLGTIMTVRYKYADILEMEEDRAEFTGNGWSWFPEMIAGLWIEEPLDDDTTDWSRAAICSLLS